MQAAGIRLKAAGKQLYLGLDTKHTVRGVDTRGPTGRTLIARR